MAVTAGIIGAVASVGGTAYGIKKTVDAKNDAQDAAKEQKEQQAKLEAELKDKELKDQSTDAMLKTRNRQKSLAAGAQGREGTILTSPLGVSDASGAAPGAAGKTLLGA
jgi:hypothetical protein